MTDFNIQQQMEEIYRHQTQSEIPWNMDSPPELLKEIVDSGKIKPCKIVDLGCGVGNYSIYFALEGFDVTGIDFSPSAIKIAKLNAVDKDAKCKFITADLLEGCYAEKAEFGFAFDWELLHHIFPEQREKYVKNISDLLVKGGKYLSVCFSEEDPQFGGEGKIRKTPLGTELYFSSEKELKKLFKKYFKIETIKTVDIKGKKADHIAVYVFMTKIK